MILSELFETFLLLGAFSFGGGLGSMELIRSRVVNLHAWLTDAEFTDIISISEMTPGPLGINIASFVGVRIGGIPGTLLATYGYVIPSFFLIMILSWAYYRYRGLKTVQGILKGLRPAVAAMIITSAVKITGNAVWGGIKNISVGNTNGIALALCAVMVVLLQKKKLKPVPAILISGAVGGILYALTGI